MSNEGAIFADYRLVVAKFLYVRKKAASRSGRIGILNHHDVVRLIKKNKDWTLVETIGEGDYKLRGWVFTRYLKKLI
ncbi:MAG: SH3 domain-containing protein [bacterium]|nr:SH3 domain-containing protein [bacterium]